MPFGIDTALTINNNSKLELSDCFNYETDIRNVIKREEVNKY